MYVSECKFDEFFIILKYLRCRIQRQNDSEKRQQNHFSKTTFYIDKFLLVGIKSLKSFITICFY